MIPSQTRDALIKEYARLRKIGDRAGAKRVWAKLHVITNACLGVSDG